MTPPNRSRTEAWDLVTRAVGLRRRGAPQVTVLAALDQAETSLRHEPRKATARRLSWVCRAVRAPERDEDRIDAVLRAAAHELRRDPSEGSTP